MLNLEVAGIYTSAAGPGDVVTTRAKGQITPKILGVFSSAVAVASDNSPPIRFFLLTIRPTHFHTPSLLVFPSLFPSRVISISTSLNPACPISTGGALRTLEGSESSVRCIHPLRRAARVQLLLSNLLSAQVSLSDSILLGSSNLICLRDTTISIYFENLY